MEVNDIIVLKETALQEADAAADSVSEDHAQGPDYAGLRWRRSRRNLHNLPNLSRRLRKNSRRLNKRNRIEIIIINPYIPLLPLRL